MDFLWEKSPVSREDLKQKVLQTLIPLADGPKIVLNQFCTALSSYIVNMLPEWPTAIEDVITKIQTQQIPNVDSKMQFWIMLEVLTAIPEEVRLQAMKVLTSAALRNEIANKAPFVMNILENYLEHQVAQEWTEDDFDDLIRVVKCIGTWARNVGGYQIHKCQKICGVLVKIINKSYWPCIQEGDGCMSADENELAESALKTLINIMNQPKSHLYAKSAVAIMKLFLDSLTDITKAEWKKNNNNEDIVVNIYTLIKATIERHSGLLLSGITTTDPELADCYRRIIEVFLQCTNKPGIYPVEESCSSLANGFWFLLKYKVLSIRTAQHKSKCVEKIKPLYAHLTRILVKKAQQPDENAANTWNSDDFETFRCYRQNISETLRFCFDVLQNNVLDVLASVLDEAIVELQTNPMSWTKLEACIFAFYSVAEHIDTVEMVHIPKLMEVLTGVPYEKVNDKVLGTALEAVGSYCFWFHENPSYIPSAIQLLVKGLSSSMTSQAILALKDLCIVCQVQMRPYDEPLLDACNASLSSNKLENTDAIRLMYSIGKLMSLLHSKKIPTYLYIFLTPCFVELRSICKAGVKNADEQIRTVFRLNMISTLFATLNTNVEDDDPDRGMFSVVQPVLVGMKMMMPFFAQIAGLWRDENEVIEAICAVGESAISNFGAGFRAVFCLN